MTADLVAGGMWTSWSSRPGSKPDAPRVECATRGIKLALRAPQRADFKGGAGLGAHSESFRTFRAYRYPGAARTFFTRCYWRATTAH